MEPKARKELNLGILVGEETGGTNGAPATLESIEVRVRFKATRAVRPDGTPVQGHGFVRDVIVHPTKAGTIAGRDEILEAAIRVATEQ